MENNLYAVPFDPDKLEVTGDPISLVQDLLLLYSGPQYAVSDSGTLVYVTGSTSNHAQLEWYDRQGNQIGSVGEPASYRQFSLSPDEKRVVIERISSGGSDDLWVLELDRNGLDSRITFDDYQENDPIWSPDGDYIAFRSNRTTPDSLYRKAPMAEGKVELIKESQGKTLIPEDWSNSFVAYMELSDKGQTIFLLPLSDDHDPKLFTEGNYNYDEPKLSPDDKWLAYVSNEGVGIDEVYIRELEGDGFWRISTKGGMHPQWREDGKEIFYLDLNGSMMAVELRGEAKEPTQPEELFQTGIIFDPRYDSYAVQGDGEKFLILKPLISGGISSINIVLNWFEELKERVPIP